MAYKARKKTVLFKKETTYSVDPTPTGAANAIQTSEFALDPVEGEDLETNYDKPTLGSDPVALVGEHVRIRFKVKVAGAGAAGDVPAWGSLIEACAYTINIDAGVSVEYAPDDDGTNSGTLYFKSDGVLHKVTGCRGKVTITGQNRQHCHFEFELIGLYNAPIAAGAIVPDYSGFVRPLAWRAATVNCSWNGVSLGTHEFKLDGGQKVDFYEHSNAETIQLEDRKAMCDLKFEEPAIGTTDIFALCRAETEAALLWQLGTVAGNIVRIDAPKYQPRKPKRDNEKGIACLSFSGPLVADGAVADHTITVL
jgi:hypothetical protein